MTSLYQILMLILSVAKFFVFAHFIMSWLISFQVLNIRQPLVQQVWYGLNRLLEPLLGPLKDAVPEPRQQRGLEGEPIAIAHGEPVDEVDAQHPRASEAGVVAPRCHADHCVGFEPFERRSYRSR